MRQSTIAVLHRPTSVVDSNSFGNYAASLDRGIVTGRMAFVTW